MNIHDDPDDIEHLMAIKLQTHQISDELFHRIESYIAEIFSSFGLDLEIPATKDTPPRFIKLLLKKGDYNESHKLIRKPEIRR